ncbi:MAG: hypothetical protein COB62_03200 [Piscirickettsiaceae bacterium]|nr:MAG: hypothetical protein COB62_03200 [Piscirickettsiaceae bacterium]
MNNFRYAFVIVTCSMCLPAYPLGDLFFSVGERAKLDFKRANNQITEGKVDAVSSITLNGFYFKSRDHKNKATYWVNQKQVQQPDINSAVRVQKIDERNGTVSIQINEMVNEISLKPGQKIALDQGRISEAFDK